MKICIVKLSAFGDIVHSSVVLQFIKTHFKTAEIWWVCEDRFANLLENHTLISGIIKLNLKDKKFLQSYKSLKNAPKFDIILDLQGLIKSAIVARILGKNIVGFDKNSIRESLASLFYSKKVACDYSQNIIIRNLTLVSKGLNFELNKQEILDKNPCFVYKNQKEPNSFKKGILIVVGSSVKTKIYPKFTEVINSLKEYEIYLSANTKSELEMANKISKKTHAKILKPTTLSDLAKNIRNFTLVIGGDSGPTHLAWAQNVPSITIYGYTPHFRNSFETSVNLTIHSGKEIDPKKLDKNDFCISKIEPKDIANLAKELLK